MHAELSCEAEQWRRGRRVEVHRYTVPAAARRVVERLDYRWTSRTVRDLWHARNPYLAGVVRDAFLRGCCRSDAPVTVNQAIDDVAAELDIPRGLVVTAYQRINPLGDPRLRNEPRDHEPCWNHAAPLPGVTLSAREVPSGHCALPGLPGVSTVWRRRVPATGQGTVNLPALSTEVQILPGPLSSRWHGRRESHLAIAGGGPTHWGAP